MKWDLASLILRFALAEEGGYRLRMVFGMVGQRLVGGRHLEQRIEPHVLAFAQQPLG